MPRRVDAIVIGGGPAGATAAIVLAKAGWRVAIFEQAPFPRRKVCGEFISASSLPLFQELGVDILREAGPEVRRVAIFGPDEAVMADMPRASDGTRGWGRAVGRDVLDTRLLEHAASAGAELYQPAAVTSTTRAAGCHICRARYRGSNEDIEIAAPILIAAHGSWNPGTLPTQPEKTSPRSSDLFGFKAHFHHTRLPLELMPLVTFPGGYGGMVHSDDDRVSLSCCVRRDTLARCRRTSGSALAGEAVLNHMRTHCAPLRDVMDGATIDEHGWQATGPIRPGIRAAFRDGTFFAGNAAGEAHPVVAEGISMAMQSGWLLARALVAGENPAFSYSRAWTREFAWRIRAAAAVAQWAMRPLAVSLSLPALRAFPSVLTEGARTTGKVSPLCLPSS